MDTFDQTPLSPQEVQPLTPLSHSDTAAAVEPRQEEIPVRSAAPEAPKPYFVPQPPRQEIPQIPVRQEAPVQPQPAPQPAPQLPPRRPSPYENSPYVRMPRQEESFPYTPQQRPEAPKKKSGFWRRFLAAVLTIALVAGGCGITALAMNRHWDAKNTQTVDQLNLQIQQLQQQLQDLQNRNSTPSGSVVTGPVAPGEAMSPAQVYNQNVSSVVAINIQVDSYYYGQSATVGSGFILTEDGYVVTNFHVVEGASAVSVSFMDGTELPATVVGFDSTNDVAVLKVEATGLPAVTVGSSSELIIGDMVVAIGNPLGELTATQTLGLVTVDQRLEIRAAAGN